MIFKQNQMKNKCYSTQDKLSFYVSCNTEWNKTKYSSWHLIKININKFYFKMCVCKRIWWKALSTGFSNSNNRCVSFIRQVTPHTKSTHIQTTGNNNKIYIWTHTQWLNNCIIFVTISSSGVLTNLHVYTKNCVFSCATIQSIVHHFGGSRWNNQGPFPIQ